jgi:hypothetical protein
MAKYETLKFSFLLVNARRRLHEHHQLACSHSDPSRRQAEHGRARSRIEAVDIVQRRDGHSILFCLDALPARWRINRKAHWPESP